LDPSAANSVGIGNLTKVGCTESGGATTDDSEPLGAIDRATRASSLSIESGKNRRLRAEVLRRSILMRLSKDATSGFVSDQIRYRFTVIYN
jgi:hypothetical protein